MLEMMWYFAFLTTSSFNHYFSMQWGGPKWTPLWPHKDKNCYNLLCFPMPKIHISIYVARNIQNVAFSKIIMSCSDIGPGPLWSGRRRINLVGPTLCVSIVWIRDKELSTLVSQWIAWLIYVGLSKYKVSLWRRRYFCL